MRWRRSDDKPAYGTDRRPYGDPVADGERRRCSRAAVLRQSYTVKGCNEWRHNWKRTGRLDAPSKLSNLDLWLEFEAALDAFPIRLEWVKGHAGIKGYVRADKLSWDGFRATEGM